MEQPNYKKIYNDIIESRYPDKKDQCAYILQKKMLTTLDIIKLSQIVFNSYSGKNKKENQKHRSYDESSIIEMLNYQRENKLNNTDLSRHFNVSRNSITKWKAIFKL